MKGSNHGVLAVKAYTDKDRITQIGKWAVDTETKPVQDHSKYEITHDSIVKESKSVLYFFLLKLDYPWPLITQQSAEWLAVLMKNKKEVVE